MDEYVVFDGRDVNGHRVTPLEDLDDYENDDFENEED